MNMLPTSPQRCKKHPGTLYSTYNPDYFNKEIAKGEKKMGGGTLGLKTVD